MILYAFPFHPRGPSLVGIDYDQASYDSYHSRNVSRPMVSSETSSAWGDRDEYRPDANHVSEYNQHAGTEWDVSEEDGAAFDGPSLTHRCSHTSVRRRQTLLLQLRFNRQVTARLPRARGVASASPRSRPSSRATSSRAVRDRWRDCLHQEGGG